MQQQDFDFVRGGRKGSIADQESKPHSCEEMALDFVAGFPNGRDLLTGEAWVRQEGESHMVPGGSPSALRVVFWSGQGWRTLEHE